VAVVSAVACSDAPDGVQPPQHPPLLRIESSAPIATEVWGLTAIAWQGGSPHMMRHIRPFEAGTAGRTISFPGIAVAPLDSVRIVTEVLECSSLAAVDTTLPGIPESQVTRVVLASPPSPLARLAPGEVACGGGDDPRAPGSYFFRLRVDTPPPLVEGYWTIDFTRTHRGWHGRWATTSEGQQLTLTLEGTPGDPPCGPTTAHVEMEGDRMTRITFENPEGCIVPDVPTSLYAAKPWPGVPQP
jgi:hypothetical protein